jgi:hypothetical protein
MDDRAVAKEMDVPLLIDHSIHAIRLNDKMERPNAIPPTSKF